MTVTAVRELPDDDHNRALVSAVHPESWVNPTPRGRYNLVVVGGGTAGLVSAVGAASLGARVALVERHLLGGDCLNYGCVPSKALIRAGQAAHDVRTGEAFGVFASGVRFDFGAAMERMRRLRAQIAPHDSAARLAGLGIDVFLGEGQFVAEKAVEVDGRRLEFARAVIATGARAAAIDGLAGVGYLTNETVFSLTELPRRLVVIGAGPIACELAQAFRRFGSEVTLVARSRQLLPREDPDAAAVIAARFAAEGIRLVLGISEIRAADRADGKTIMYARNGEPGEVTGDAILVAIGRTPNVDRLGIAAANVSATERGIEVDDRLRTTNRHVFAAGDVASRYQFTHAADAMARIVLQNALFFGRKRASGLVIPWCTYTDPEIAHVGLYAHEAEERGISFTTLTVPLAGVDRAILDGDTEGFARAHIDRKGRILGITLVSRHAGESIGEAVLAMTQRLRIGALASTIHPYPTQAEALKKLGDAFQRTRLTPFVRGIFERLLRWRR
ncbi:MAG: mercuric reductase [Kofleriaceae bacterium]